MTDSCSRALYKLLTRRYGEGARFRRFETKRRTPQEMWEKEELLGKVGSTGRRTSILVEEVVEREAILAQAARRKKAQTAGPKTPPAAGREKSRPPPRN